MTPAYIASDDISALVASGDLFITVATAIESIGDRVVAVDAKPQIEQLIANLLYLQRHYQVTKKAANFRQ